MSVLVFIDTAEGQPKKTSLEALSYGAALAVRLGTHADAVWLGPATEPEGLGAYGAKKIYHIDSDSVRTFDAQVAAQAITAAAEQSGASVVVCSNNVNGKAVAPRVAVRLKAGLVSGAVSLPQESDPSVIRKSVFSGKAFAHVSIRTDRKVIALNPNAYPVVKGEGLAECVALAPVLKAGRVTVRSTSRSSGDVPLTEAEVVVSAGRGMKGPENWGMVEDLAKTLRAALACSRPVADAHWRPHHEHVGQTGIAIAPNLYIAIGISGAIQHLAGVNRSKVIVVINKDPEAPFFKAADYGIVGDAFDVVPRLSEAIRKLKGQA
ncbi:MAG: hypothetical protein RJA57_1764 [Bacteroidota bacterium]|jgi:electron transfer flavoprotein alpha subunit